MKDAQSRDEVTFCGPLIDAELAALRSIGRDRHFRPLQWEAVASAAKQVNRSRLALFDMLSAGLNSTALAIAAILALGMLWLIGKAGLP